MPVNKFLPFRRGNHTNKTVRTYRIEEYDIVAEPGFSNARLLTSDEFPTLLPIATRVAAQTIGLDLVSVQPLSAPRLESIYLDFKYDDWKEPELPPDDDSEFEFGFDDDE